MRSFLALHGEGSRCPVQTIAGAGAAYGPVAVGHQLDNLISAVSLSSSQSPVRTQLQPPSQSQSQTQTHSQPLSDLLSARETMTALHDRHAAQSTEQYAQETAGIRDRAQQAREEQAISARCGVT